MELNQIRYFIQTAQLQNMSKAARALNIAQPTLSKSIANLEKELGTKLFDRSGKKLILNERGKRFLDHAVISMQELDGAVTASQDNLIDHTLHIGLYHFSDRFMQCLSEFSIANPHIIFEIKHLINDNIDTNEFDMLLYSQNSQFKRYKGQLLYTDTYCVAVNSLDSLASRDTVSLTELMEHKLILLKYSDRLNNMPYYMIENMGIADTNIIYTNNRELQRQMISKGIGIGFISMGSSQDYRKDENITLLNISDISLTEDIMVGFKREKHLSEYGKIFADFVLRYFCTV